jgi:hypothetical protein
VVEGALGILVLMAVMLVVEVVVEVGEEVETHRPLHLLHPNDPMAPCPEAHLEVVEPTVKRREVSSVGSRSSPSLPISLYNYASAFTSEILDSATRLRS